MFVCWSKFIFLYKLVFFWWAHLQIKSCFYIF